MVTNILNKLVLVAKGLVPFAIIFALIPIGIVGFRLNGKLDNFERAAISSADAAQITANTYSEVGYATKDTLDNHVSPAIDQIAADVNKTNREIRGQIRPLADNINAVIKTTDKSLDQNSTAFLANQNLIANDVHTNLVSANKILDNANGILTGTEIEQLLSDLAASGHRVRVIVEDPALQQALVDLPPIVTSTATNVDKITFEVAGMATTANKKLNETLYPPPAKGFWGKFGRGLKVSLGWLVTGAQTGYYLFRIAK